MENDNFHYRVPEMDMPEDLIHALEKYYRLHEDKVIRYINENGNNSGLGILPMHHDEVDGLLEYTGKIFPEYFFEFYLIVNSGLDKHVDDNRQSVLTVEILNPEHVGTRFYDDDGSFELKYKQGEAHMISTQQYHSVDESAKERVFFQMELDRNYSFDDIKYVYRNGGICD